MDLTNKSELLNYLKQHKLWAKKGLSQNFLVDKEALDKIVEAADIKPDNFVVEVGPGVGVLTEKLIEKAGHVVSIELDNKLYELLKLKKSDKFEIFNADILKVNLDEVIEDKPYKVVANIPYAITSKIFELFLSREHKPELLVLLVQKEVAKRVCAKPGDMSILAISVQLFGQPEIIDIVPANSFFPVPKVDSAILKIVPGSQFAFSKEEEKHFFRLIHIGFSARRKTLANNLSVGYQLDREKVLAIIKNIGLKETVRAQELTLEQWRQLCSHF